MATLDTGSIVLNWAKAGAQEGISHYRIYMDGKVIANTLDDSNFYTVNNIPLYIEHSFYVVGVTTQCRVTGPSNVVKMTVPISPIPTPTSNDLDFNLNKYL